MNLVLHLTDSCNLDCSYCYYKNNRQESNMTFDTARKAVDFLIDIARKYGDTFLNITYFGGEPLLQYELIRRTVEYCEFIENFEFRHGINTNGTLLTDEILDYLEEKHFTTYISIDGTETVHDRNRPTKRGEGSFASIRPHLDRLARMGAHAEKVIAVNTIDNTYDSVVFLQNLGFHHTIVAPDFNDPQWNRAHFERLEKQYLRLSELFYKAQKRNKNFSINLFSDKIQGHLAKVSLKKTICNIGERIYAVDARENIFPCTRFISNTDDQYVMGTLDGGFDPKRVLKIRNYHLDDKAQCRECTIKDRCFGNGCGCTSYYTTGSIEGISPLVCEHERMITRIADDIGEKLYGK